MDVHRTAKFLSGFSLFLLLLALLAMTTSGTQRPQTDKHQTSKGASAENSDSPSFTEQRFPERRVPQGKKSAWPLLKQDDFVYLGAFRVPEGKFGTSRFGYGGKCLAFNPNDPAKVDDDTLFISGHTNHVGSVAEISIPTPVESDETQKLPVAEIKQAFGDVTEGKTSQIKHGGSVHLGGLLVHGDRLIWSAFNFYDASYRADRSHGFSTLDVDASGDAGGMYKIDGPNPGFIAGYMAHVPEEWRQEFGPALTGQANLNIITRTSSGPAIFGFDPGLLGKANPVPSVPLLYYPTTIPLGGGMGSKNPLFNYNSSVGGVVFPIGTRSVVFFGGHATGEHCYGTAEHCKDPVRGGKGNHDVGGNYVYQAWAYDALTLAKARRSRQPPTLQPYAIWQPNFPTKMANAQIGGVAYDELTNRVFLVQYQADRTNRFEAKPLVHIFEVKPTRAVKTEVGTGSDSPNRLNEQEPVERSALRTFRDGSGRFSIQAVFIEIKDGKVRLRNADGDVVAVSISQLSEEDRDWVRQELKRRKSTKDSSGK